MSSLRSAVIKSAVYAICLGALVALVLYFLSTWFFQAKNNQTLIKATELGNISGGERVFPVGAVMPEVQFEVMGSTESYSLKTDSAPVKIVNFWASWCEPCVEEFSSFARLVRELDGEVSFVGVSEDKTYDEAAEFLKAFSSDFKGLKNIYFGFDKDKFFSGKYGILALPETFLVDSKGKLIRRVSGFEKWDSPSAVEYFKALVQKNKEGAQ